MWIQLKQVEAEDTRVKITLDPQVSPILLPMVKKPLRELADMIVERMEEMSF
jgi:hypothetical protein